MCRGDALLYLVGQAVSAATYATTGIKILSDKVGKCDSILGSLTKGSIMKRRYRLLATIILLAICVIPQPADAFEVVEPGETQTFTQADRCEGTPTFSNAFKGENSFCIPAIGRAEAATLLTISGINLNVTAFGTVITDFLVTSTNSETVLDATVSADVSWNGLLFGAGILGAGASVVVEMSLVDEDTGVVTGKTTIVNKSQDSTGLKGLDVGGTRFSGNSEVTFLGKVVRGHSHSINLKVTCNSESGLIGLDVGCIFQTDVFGLGLGGDHFVKWNSLSITVEQDIFERFDRIDEKLEVIDGKIDQLDMKTDEVIRLLHTPQGKRQSDIPACDGNPCDFPEKRNKKKK